MYEVLVVYLRHHKFWAAMWLTALTVMYALGIKQYEVDGVHIGGLNLVAAACYFVGAVFLVKLSFEDWFAKRRSQKVAASRYRKAL